MNGGPQGKPRKSADPGGPRRGTPTKKATYARAHRSKTKNKSKGTP